MCDLFHSWSFKTEDKLKQYDDNMHNYCCRQLSPQSPYMCLRNTSCAKIHPAYQCWNLTVTNTQVQRVQLCIELISWYFKSKCHAAIHESARLQKIHQFQLTCLACYFPQCFLKIFLFFQKMLHLVQITDVTAFNVSFNVLRPVSCVFHAPYMPFWYQVYTSGIDFNPHDFYCPNGFSFMFQIFFKYSVLVHHTVTLAPYITNPFIYTFDINWSETANKNLQLIISRFCP